MEGSSAYGLAKVFIVRLLLWFASVMRLYWDDGTQPEVSQWQPMYQV